MNTIIRQFPDGMGFTCGTATVFARKDYANRAYILSIVQHLLRGGSPSCPIAAQRKSGLRSPSGAAVSRRGLDQKRRWNASTVQCGGYCVIAGAEPNDGNSSVRSHMPT